MIDGEARRNVDGRVMDMDTAVDFKPYEEPEPYVFVSYSHRDTEAVIPLLNAMHAAGYRVWYDEGIQAGSKWTDSLAEHITNCAVFMPLHTAASVKSEFCYDEIHFARSKGKPIVPVYLEDVELPDGLQLLLHPYQHMKVSDSGGIDEFVNKLEDESVFHQCTETALPSVSPTAIAKIVHEEAHKTDAHIFDAQLNWKVEDRKVRWAFLKNKQNARGNLIIVNSFDSNGRMRNYMPVPHFTLPVLFFSLLLAYFSLFYGLQWFLRLTLTAIL